ncbi:hypothetical protein FRC10_000902 [Ceratobasidium sp. 414]|nr:hypothetical protein FRC10_000902 [Ceratobasidium sp. 414]
MTDQSESSSVRPMAMLDAPGSVDGGNPPETGQNITHERSNLEHFRMLMSFVTKGNDMEDTEALECLLPLFVPGRIRELVDYGLKESSVNLEQPIAEAKLLCMIGDRCASRYTRLDRLELVDIALECYRRAISVAPNGTLDEADIHSVMGNLHWQRSRRLEELSDINMAIACLNHAALLVPDGPAKLDVLRDLGLSYRGRFNHLKQTADIDLAILYHTQAVSLVSDDDLNKPTHLGNLGNSYLRRFEHLREPLDLDKSVAYHSQAESMTPDAHPHKAGMLNNLAGSYLWRFESLGRLEDLDMTIAWYGQAASLTADGHADKPGMLASLGQSHGRRFQQLGDITDMDTAISCHLQALSLTSNGRSQKPEILESLGNLYTKRFKRLGELPDLDASTAAFSQAVASTPGINPRKPERLHSLGLSHAVRFERTGELQDLNFAIAYLGEATSLVPEKHRHRLDWLNDLGLSLSNRFEYMGELPDLEAAAACHCEAVSMTPDGHPDKPFMLIGLGRLHSRRFKRFGEVADIDQAILCYSQAASLTPAEHPDRWSFLVNLGSTHTERFEYLEERADNEMALEYFNMAASLAPDENLNRPELFYNLGNSYATRFGYTNQLSDLDTAITYEGLALSLTPEGHPMKLYGLNNLGISYSLRFEHSDELADLSQSIQYYTQTASLAPNDHPHKPAALMNLGNSHRKRFKRLGEPADMDLPIVYHSQAVSLTLPGDPRRQHFLGELGNSHFERYQRLGTHENSVLAMDCYMQAAQSTSGKPLYRLTMARQWANLSIICKSSTTLGAYTQAMALIPQAVWLGSTTEQRYEQILNVGSLALDAATYAIVLGDYNLALEWLEQGRSIVWNQLVELRTPLDELAIVHPVLAQDLQQTSHRLDRVLSVKRGGLEMARGQYSLEEVAQQHRRLAERWEKLVQQAQSLPGLQGFLRPKKAPELMAAARATTIVMVVVHQYGCYALIIQAQEEIPGRIAQLESFTYNKAFTARARLTGLLRTQGRTTRGVSRSSEQGHVLEDILRDLWIDLAKPILDILGFTETELPTEQLPHITWCLTGPLAFLPLHAAGDYSKPGCSLFDYAVSSYTPNIASLLVTPLPSKLFSGIVVVGQAATPGFSPLPGTEAELNQTSSRANGVMPLTRLERDKATQSAVLAAMKQHSWVHLACHARQDPKRPTASAFYLHDGPLDLATITQKRLEHADLAFLSACQTATGDHDLPEEAVHLAAGMIMAGYRRVIATMWSIDDKDAPLVADRFYAYMLDARMSDTNKASNALHHAVGCLREGAGVKAFARWAPYIHLGL